jgi:hypothetical protein
VGETTNATYCLADLDGVCKFVVLITTFILLAFLREKTCAVVDYSYVRTYTHAQLGTVAPNALGPWLARDRFETSNLSDQ